MKPIDAQRTLRLAWYGTGITLGFAVFNGVYGLLYQSIWYGVFAFYYLVLGGQKTWLLLDNYRVGRRFDHNPSRLARAQQRIYRRHGIILVPLTLALIVLITIILSLTKPDVTGEIIAITIATYTTYKITMAIINLCRAKKLSHPVLQALRNLNLVEALTTIIMLESTLITSFGTLDTSMRIIIIISGAVVCGFNLVLATLMMIKGSRTLLGNSDLPTA